jgi:hypothetical protein
MLAYSAPPECPDRAALVAAIRERTPDARLDGARSYTVAITKRDDAYAGVVDGRELTAAQCGDLVTALALVVSLSLEEDKEQPPAPVASTWQLDADAAAAVGLGITPDPLLVIVAEVRARRRGALAISAGFLVGHDQANESPATATFTFVGARAAGCWLPVDDGTVELGACGHIEVGGVRATGEGVPQSRGVTRLWLAPGLDARARWRATDRVFAELAAGASTPLVRDRYLFEPNMTIHETSIVTTWFQLGIGVRFR